MRITVVTLIVLAFSVVTFTGCGNNSNQSGKKNNGKEQQSKDPGQAELRIAGKITNPKTEKVRIAVKPGNESETWELDHKGNFEGALKLKEPSYLQFHHGNQYTNCYGAPGDSIYLSLDFDQFDESLQYSGTKSTINNYLASKILLEDTVSLAGNRMEMKALYKKQPGKFSQHVDSVHNIYKTHFEEYFNDKSVSGKFKKYEAADIDYRFYSRKATYPMLYTRFNEGKEPELSNKFFAYRENVDLGNPALLNVPSYMQYVGSHVQSKQREYMEKLDTSFVVVYKEIVKNEIPSDTIKARVLEQFIDRFLQRRGVEAMQPLLSYYKTLPYSPETMKKIDSIKAERKQIASGKEAPEFAYPTIEGDTVSLADLEGSYVYIDVWATWCKPCKKEIPHLKKLHAKFKDRNIKFVSISIDDEADRNKWRSLVKNKNLKGYQLFATNSKIQEAYMISSIPRFILIGPEGKIIDADADRPSRNIEARLKQLLSKDQSV